MIDYRMLHVVLKLLGLIFIVVSVGSNRSTSLRKNRYQNENNNQDIIEEPSEEIMDTAGAHYNNSTPKRRRLIDQTEIIKNYDVRVLRKSILENIDPSIRPVLNQSTPVELGFRIKIYEIMGLSETDQSLSLLASVRMEWKDEFIQWADTEFAHIKGTTIPPEKIWVPPMSLENTKEKTFEYSQQIPIRVSSTGMAVFTNLLLVTASCRISIFYFPFDRQVCTLDFNTRGYNEATIKKHFIPTEILVSYKENAEWQLEKIKEKKQKTIYKTWQHLRYQIYMKRRPLYYVFNLLVPNIVLLVIAGFQFILPCESGEKLTLGVSALLSMIIFLMVMSEKLPTNSLEIPMIGVYFGISILLNAACVLVTIFNMNVFFRDDPDIPPSLTHRQLYAELHSGSNPYSRRVQELFLYHLAKRLMVTTKFTRAKRKYENMRETLTKQRQEPVDVQIVGHHEGAQPKGNTGEKQKPLELEMWARLPDLPALVMGMPEDVVEELFNEGGEECWQDVARVLDRVFFVIVNMTILIMTLIVFAQFNT